jgi:hypothetical protein
VSSKTKYRLLTVINAADDFSSSAQKSIGYSNCKALTAENAIDKTESTLTSENALDLQIERTLTLEQPHYRIFHPGSNKGPEC